MYVFNNDNADDLSPSVIQNDTTQGFVNATYAVNPVVGRKSVKFETTIDNDTNSDEDDGKGDSVFYYKKNAVQTAGRVETHRVKQLPGQRGSAALCSCQVSTSR